MTTENKTLIRKNPLGNAVSKVYAKTKLYVDWLKGVNNLVRVITEDICPGIKKVNWNFGLRIMPNLYRYLKNIYIYNILKFILNVTFNFLYFIVLKISRELPSKFFKISLKISQNFPKNVHSITIRSDTCSVYREIFGQPDWQQYKLVVYPSTCLPSNFQVPLVSSSPYMWSWNLENMKKE